MKTYEITYFRNGHKYTTSVKGDNVENALAYAEIICEIEIGNITSIKEV